MKARLKGTGFIKKYFTGKEVELEPGTRLGQLPALLDLPGQYRLIFIVNGKVTKADYEISEGDCIIIVSALSGG